MSSAGGDSDRGEVAHLREEVLALNGLLEESASALFALSEKLHTERERNEKLSAYIEEVDESLQSSCAETAYLRSIVSDLQKKNQALENALLEAQSETNTPATRDGAKIPQYSTLLEIVTQQASAINSRSSDLRELRLEILSSTNNLADELCDQMVEADAELATLMSRFPSVDFERKAPEIDPYKSTKGWSGRHGRKNTEDSPESDVNSGNYSHHKATPEHVEGYLFGSPSERFPMSKHSDLREDNDEGEDEVVPEDPSHGVRANENFVNEDGPPDAQEDAQSVELDEAVLENVKVDLNAYNEWELANSS